MKLINPRADTFHPIDLLIIYFYWVHLFEGFNLLQFTFNSFPAKWFLVDWLSPGIFTYVLWSKTLYV